MRIIDLKKFETSTDKLEYYKVFRPLLSFSKDYILFLCKHNHIRFYQDLSNFDENLSKRNQIRKTISNIIANSNFEKDSSLFYSSFQNLYDFLEQDRQSSDQNSSKLSKMIVSNYWNAKRAYVLDGEILETQDLVQLLKKL
ncbi:MAG: ATP-binding protein [Patescibacteria group bacterium]